MKKSRLVIGIAFLLIVGIFIFKLISVDPPTPTATNNTRPNDSSKVDINTTPDVHQDDKAIEADNSEPQYKKYELQDTIYSTSFVAPSYIDNQQIAFEYDVTDDHRSYIDLYHIDKQQKENIYTGPKGKFINSLIGINGSILWIEFDRDYSEKVEWEIKRMDIKSGTVTVVDNGAVEDQIEPPVIRSDGNQITWIKKIIKNGTVISNIVLYNPEDNSSTIIASLTLNEQSKIREGVFPIIQRPVKGGVLVLQTTFSTSTESTNKKSIQLMFYPLDRNFQPTLVLQPDEGEIPIDFTATDDYYIWTQFGKLTVINKQDNSVAHIINIDDDRLTIDSPFIVDNLLYYRVGVYQIYTLDLSTWEVREFSPHQNSLSKIFASDGFLGFSFMDPLDTEGHVTLYVHPTEDE